MLTVLSRLSFKFFPKFLQQILQLPESLSKMLSTQTVPYCSRADCCL